MPTPAILGTTISLDGKPSMVIGIMPPSFTNERRAQYWRPLATPNAPGVTFYYSVIGRLRGGVSIASAGAELTRIQRGFDAPAGINHRASTPVLMTLHERRYGDTRMPLLVLLAAVGVFCSSSPARTSRTSCSPAPRADTRSSRYASRSARDAGDSSHFRRGDRVHRSHRPSDAVARRSHRGRLDGRRVHAWHRRCHRCALRAGAGNQCRSCDVSQALASSGARTTSSRGHRRFRDALVVAELATALVLLTGAGTLTKSFLRILSIDSGMRPEHVLVARFALSSTKYPDATAARFLDPLIERVRRIPGVRSLSLADVAPLSGVRMSLTSNKAGDRAPGASVDVIVGDTAYFATLGIVRRAGRLFSGDDRPGATAHRRGERGVRARDVPERRSSRSGNARRVRR